MGGILIARAFLAALGQIRDPGFRTVLAKGLLLTILFLSALYVAVLHFLLWILPDVIALPWIGEISVPRQFVSLGSFLVMAALSTFLMVPFAAAFTGVFLDDVADAVEARHYPSVSPAPRISLMDGLKESISFLGIVLVANLAALVLYFTPLSPLVFFGLNGFLLGREYFRMIAVRRLGRREAGRLFRQHLPTIWIAGALMAMLLTLPLLNLLVPVLGAATFTHIYYELNSEDREECLSVNEA